MRKSLEYFSNHQGVVRIHVTQYSTQILSCWAFVKSQQDEMPI